MLRSIGSGPAPTASLPAWAVSVLRGKVAKLNKTAAKLNLPPITITKIGAFTVPADDLGLRIINMVKVRIDGTSIVLPGGWAYVGCIEHLDAGNLVNGSDPVLEDFRNSPATCDHCHLTRNRNKTLVLRSAAGRIVRVGTACMRDYLGYHGNPNTLANYASMLGDFFDSFDDFDSDDWTGGGSPRFNDYPVADLLLIAAVAIRKFGWVPKSALDKGFPGINGYCSANIVSAFAGVYRPSKDELWLADAIADMRADYTDPSDADLATVAATIDWVNASTDDFGYMADLKVLVNSDTVTDRKIGFLISAVGSYTRHLDRCNSAKAEAAAHADKPSDWVGEIKVRRDFLNLTVLSRKTFDGTYGTTLLLVMVDPDGNVIKTFSTGNFGWDLNPGDTVSIKATVKDHDIYNDRKETVVNRAKALG